MQRSILAALTAVLLNALAPAYAEEVEGAHLAAARELIAVIGGAEMYGQMIDVSLAQTWPAIEKQNPNLSKKDLDLAKKELSVALREEVEFLVDETAKIYARHLTVGEMQASIAFYKSPEGKAMLSKLPVIMGEAMELGSRYGAKVSESALERARQRLKEQGVEI